MTHKTVATAPGLPSKTIALTKEEIAAKTAEETKWAKARAVNKYARDRVAEYPPIEELIVAMWEDLVEGDTTASKALQEVRLAVKAKYPKGE